MSIETVKAQENVKQFSTEHTSEMKDVLKRVEKNLSSNKNKFALQDLKLYDGLITNQISSQHESIQAKLIKEFNAEQKSRQIKIRTHETKITELKSQSGDIGLETADMSRKTLFIILLIIGLGSVVLFVQMKKYRNLQEIVSRSGTKREFSDERVANIASNTEQLVDKSTSFRKLVDKVIVIPTLSTLASGKRHESAPRKAANLIHKLQIAKQAVSLGVDFAEKMDQEPEISKINLNGLIEEMWIIVLNSKKFEDPSLRPEIKTDLEAILPEIEIDPNRVRFSLYHLMSNAIDAVTERSKNNEKGYIPSIMISTRKLPQFIQVRIKDNGVGIEQKELETIFDPFYSGKNERGYIGIGLTKSYDLITEFHKGELLVESELGNGSDFVIRFPLKQHI